jgi:hypothetical protein
MNRPVRLWKFNFNLVSPVMNQALISKKRLLVELSNKVAMNKFTIQYSM